MTMRKWPGSGRGVNNCLRGLLSGGAISGALVSNDRSNDMGLFVIVVCYEHYNGYDGKADRENAEE